MPLPTSSIRIVRGGAAGLASGRVSTLGEGTGVAEAEIGSAGRDGLGAANPRGAHAAASSKPAIVMAR
jgi:hypothetical protein